jgi:hypothetical protein
VPEWRHGPPGAPLGGVQRQAAHRRIRSPGPYLRPSPCSGQPGQWSGRVKDRRSRPRSGAAGVLDAAAERPTITPRGWATPAHGQPEGCICAPASAPARPKGTSRAGAGQAALCGAHTAASSSTTRTWAAAYFAANIGSAHAAAQLVAAAAQVDGGLSQRQPALGGCRGIWPRSGLRSDADWAESS